MQRSLSLALMIFCSCYTVVARPTTAVAPPPDVLTLSPPIPFQDHNAAGAVVDPVTIDPAAAIVGGGTVQNINAAKSLILKLVGTIRATDPKCDATKSTFLINVVVFDNSGTAPLIGDSQKLFTNVGPVKSSNWYLYEPDQNSFLQASSGQTARIYGDSAPYIIAIHLNSNDSAYQFSYQYVITHRKAANIQDLEDAITLYKAIIPGSPGAPAAPASPPNYHVDFWAWGQLSVNTPAGLTIAAGIALKGPPPTMPSDITALEKTPGQFDDEGFYHWDVSVGVPITSYSQIQSVNPTTGAAPVPATIDRRNLIAIFDYYVKPVDLKGTKFSYIPYPLAGVSFASKPLHNVLVGAGIGPTTAGFYVGAMIVTSNLPNRTTATHIKLGFGLNLPVRAIMSKLGVNTQVSSGGS